MNKLLVTKRKQGSIVNSSDLPTDWTFVKVGDIAKFQGGYAFKSQDYCKSGIKLFRISNVSFGKLSWENTAYLPESYVKKYANFALQNGDVLLAMTRPVVTGGIKAAQIKTSDLPCLLNQRVGKFNFDKKKINPLFMFFVIFSNEFIDSVNTQALGSEQPNISSRQVESIQIPLPPLNEQDKIASILSAVHESFENSENNLQSLRELKRSLMKHLFTYGAVSLEETTNVKLKETEIGSIPETWAIESINDSILSSQYGISNLADVKGQYPMLRMNNLSNGKVDSTDLKYVDIEKIEFEKFKLMKGNILFNRTNSIDLVGKTALFDLEEDYTFGSYLVRLELNREKLLPEFLNYYMNWDKSQNRLKTLATRAVGQSNISASRLRTLKIIQPPINEQKRICSVLETVDLEIGSIIIKKKSLERLFASMLYNLVNAKIRVNNLEL